MKSWLSLMVLLIAASCGVPKNDAQLNIIDGKPMKASDPALKSMVGMIDRNGDVLCTGIVIGPQQFLTAAHCLMTGLGKNAVIRAGASISGSRTVTKIASWTLHDEFNPAGLTQMAPTSKTADLAVVQTTTDITGAVPVALVSPEESIAAGDELRIAGFGRNDGADRNSSGKALFWDFLVGSLNPDAEELTLTDPDIHMACHGDSGGPVFKIVHNMQILVGVVSRGRSSCDSNETVITDLRGYTDWIGKKRTGVVSSSKAQK